MTDDRTRSRTRAAIVAAQAAWDAEDDIGHLKRMLWTVSSEWQHEKLHPLHERAGALLVQQTEIRTKLLLLAADIGGANE